MLFTEFGMVTEVNPLQSPKAQSPMLFTELPIVMEIKPVHHLKAYAHMLVTEFGMVMEVKPEQSSKASISILVTEFGMVMEVKPVHLLKAQTPILVTELGIMVFLHPAIKVLLLFSIMALQSSRESYISLSEATDIDSKHEQPQKAQSPMLFTELPIVTEVKPLQSPKA